MMLSTYLVNYSRNLIHITAYKKVQKKVGLYIKIILPTIMPHDQYTITPYTNIPITPYVLLDKEIT
jgi:hypothetical protein